jgi:transcription-repair coupling factor (superfamily II helicase)
VWAGRIAARMRICSFRRNSELSEIARRRLAALKEFSDLGAGFKIAALDLELRGAGNMLGGEQSGHIEASASSSTRQMLEPR